MTPTCIYIYIFFFFSTGCSTGEIYLCQFGGTKAMAGYTPMPAHLEAPAPSPQSLFTTPPKSWNPSPGVNFTHWGQPQAVQPPSTQRLSVCVCAHSCLVSGQLLYSQLAWFQ